MSIVIEKLTHRYPTVQGGGITAVDNVSFTIDKGEWVCLIGHTGSGKSTLIRHFNGLTQPTEGAVIVDDIRVSNESKQNLRPLRQKVGLVFQYPEQQLFEETVSKEIAFGPRNWGVSEEELPVRVLAALRSVGLDDSYLERNPFALSGGQKRRVAIASVLASNPDYLVLDEPTAGLDAEGCIELLSLLGQINARGVTLVQVTHDLDIAFRYATKIAVMCRGKLVIYDEPEKVALLLHDHPIEGLVLPPLVQLALSLRDCGYKAPITTDPQRLAEALGGAE